MKYLIVLLFTASVMASDKHFFDTTGLSPKEKACHATAMIGFDSVVNAGAGLEPEASFVLIDKFVNGTIKESDIPLIKVVLGAYRWKGSPHTYAIKVYGKCLK